MVIRALNVAEKNSVARELARILGHGQQRNRRGPAQQHPIWDLPCTMNGQQVDATFTSVRGHLMETEFAPPYGRKWNACQPIDLFHLPIEKYVREDMKQLEQQLKEEARKAQWLVLWLDCDREGENIAYEVINVCTQANRRLRVLRARFSSLNPPEIQAAVTRLGAPDPRASEAVEARQEIDLRLGSAFTRFQTQRLQARFEQLGEGVISYGPCQFPTLGFIVERHKRIQTFEREQFWFIQLNYEAPDSSADGGAAQASFTWDRNRLFDHLACLVLYEMCLAEPCVARVTEIRGRDTVKQRPLPLETVELTKRASNYLRMGSEHSTKVAEELYMRGIISYPRTETQKFNPDTDLRGMIGTFAGHPQWGAYANKLLNQGGFQQPREGPKDDQAHPPIHPVKCITDDNDFKSNDEKRLYELVCKHFLACCSKDALGHSTQVFVELGAERFHANGLMVIERNWLEIYAPFERWNGKHIPLFNPGQTFAPSSVLMKEGRTEPPPYLSEADLIALMDRHGIGTDATISAHIKTIQDRQYAAKNAQQRFIPSPLGVALSDGYTEMGHSLMNPALRAQMERDCAAIAAGTKQRQAVVAECLTHMKTVFEACTQQAIKLDEAMAEHFDAIGTGNSTRVTRANFSKCGRCQQMMDLKEPTGNGRRGGGGGSRLAYCRACTTGYPLPRNGRLEPRAHTCPLCGFQVLAVAQGEGYEGSGYTLCPHCFSNAPEVANETGGLRCFMCSANCALAGRIAGQDIKVFDCLKCAKAMNLSKLEREGRTTFRIGCKGYPVCKCTVWLPNSILEVAPTQERCQSCSNGQSVVLKLQFKFSRTKIPPEMSPTAICCPLCSRTLRTLGISYREFTPGERDAEHAAGGAAPHQGNAREQSNNLFATGARANNHPTNATLSMPRRDLFGGTDGGTSMNLGGANGTVNCYSCGQPGHFATACPQRGGSASRGVQPNYRGREVPSNTAEGGSRNCYKCGQLGHFASSCPQGSGGLNSFAGRGGIQSAANSFQNQQRFNGGTSGGLQNDGGPRCPGHDLPCVRRQVRKDGPNQGKFFFVCSQPQDSQCDSFKWESEWQSEQSGSGVGGGRNTMNGVGSSSFVDNYNSRFAGSGRGGGGGFSSVRQGGRRAGRGGVGQRGRGRTGGQRYSQSQQQAQPRRGGRDLTCMHCGEQGHGSRHCPSK